MNEILFRLRPLPDADWITQDTASNFSDVSFASEAEATLESDGGAGPLTVTEVCLNGASLSFQVLSPTTVRIKPRLRLEGDRLTIRCLLPKGAIPALKSHPATYPTPDYGYGLQRAANLPTRHSK